MRWYIKKAQAVEPTPAVAQPPQRLAPQEIATVVAPLNGLNYAIIGGAAMSLHGMRSSGDVDVLLPQDEIPEAVRRLGGQATPLATGGYSVTVGPYEIDLVSYPNDQGMGDAPWVEEALHGAQTTPHGRLATKPWLMAIKMHSGREKDFQDYIDIYHGMPVDQRKQTRQLINNHMPNMVDDYKSVAEMAKYLPPSGQTIQPAA
jgi:hypothetical protein